MSYYDDRRYSAPRDRGRPASGYAADYFDDHPRSRHARDERENYPYYRDDGSLEEIPRDFPPGRDYYYERSYDSRRPRRPVQETVRRASSVSGDPYHDGGHYRRSRPQRSRRYDDRRKSFLFLSSILLYFVLTLIRSHQPLLVAPDMILLLQVARLLVTVDASQSVMLP